MYKLEEDRVDSLRPPPLRNGGEVTKFLQIETFAKGMEFFARRISFRALPRDWNSPIFKLGGEGRKGSKRGKQRSRVDSAIRDNFNWLRLSFSENPSSNAA